MDREQERDRWSHALQAGGMMRKRLSWVNAADYLRQLPHDVEDLRGMHRYRDVTVSETTRLDQDGSR